MSRIWRERDHPRDPANGEFVDKPGGWLSRVAQVLPGGGSRRRDLRDEWTIEDYDAIYQHGVSAEGAMPGSDPMLGEIYRRQGFDQNRPEVVSRGELDAAIRGGWTELFRGVQERVWWDDETEHSIPQAEIAEQFRTGEHYPGGGMYGNGSYTTGWRETAAMYANYESDGMIRMAMSPDAKVVELGEIRQVWRDMVPEFDADFTAAQKAAGVGPDGWPWGYHNPKSSVLADMGRLAAAMGYDAMKVTQLAEYPPLGERSMVVHGPPEGDYYVVFNRGILKVQEASN